MTLAVSARRFASRGGLKLDAALDELAIDVAGWRIVDAGGSTGGWTDCLLQRGAREVVYVDVAYGALDYRLRTDPRVRVLERTNIRSVGLEDIGGWADLAVADLAFISLRTVAPALTGLSDRLLLLVKPQFELPRDAVPRGGVVRDPEAWIRACDIVVEAYAEEGFGLCGVAPSRLPGPKGNREFFVVFEREAASGSHDLIEDAIEDAP